MEELFPKLRDSLNIAVEIKEDENQLLIDLKVKNEDLIPGDLGSPHEIKEMIRMFGGVKQDIPMEVSVDEKTNIITIKMLKKEDFEIVRTVINSLWERASELLIKAFNAEPGKTEEFRDLGDFDENY